MQKETEWEDMKMTEEYFDRTKHYQEKYGNQTIVLMQAGAFLEVYGYKRDNDITYQGSLIQEFSKTCDMSISEKKIGYEGGKLFMAGFRDYQEDKYVKKLVDNNFTVVVILQEDNMQKSGAKKKVRYLKGIYSPGTYINYETQPELQWSNNIMCVWIEKTISQRKQCRYVFGISVLNIITGQTYMTEYEIEDIKLQPVHFDDMERCLSIYNPREIIIVTDDLQIKDYLTNLRSYYSHSYDTSDTISKNATQQVYQKQVLTSLFGNDILSCYKEFEYHAVCTQCFCVLMHFIEEHNPELKKNIQLPLWENTPGHVILANHTLTQLNILGDRQEKGNTSSVHSWLNKCQTIMGKRQFLHILTHPTTNKEYLENEYNTMSVWLDNPCYSELILPLRKQLSNIYDIDTLKRQVIAKKMYPSALYKLYKSFYYTEQLFTCLADMNWLHKYLSIDNNNILNETKEIMEFIEKRVYLDACINVHQLKEFDEPILKKGVYEELDILYNYHQEQKDDLHNIRTFWERQMSATSQVGEYVKLNQTDKYGISLQMTKLRCSSLKSKMIKSKELKISDKITCNWEDVYFQPHGKVNMEIKFPYCDDLCKSIGQFQQKLNTLSSSLYIGILSEIEEKYMGFINLCSEKLANLDVLLNKCYMSQKYNYSRPIIEEKEKSFVNAEGLRHILIENINTNELYVPNDIKLGLDDMNGILLFGTNAVGKTSLMRSLGISVILAQCGMFVPSRKFVYNPYDAIYSRILNHDNLFKGLSTFQVEMSELRVILKYADKNSLILGDELCSGTETTSALCIMMSSLMRLYNRQSSFLFATHFHEIIDYDELKLLPTIKLCHLAVHYNSEQDCLVYDRVMKEGPGPCNYGLEVCKSLFVDQEFLECAYEVRKKHYPEYEGTLLKAKTTYNARKIKNKCELCGNQGEEIHHIQEQQCADENGWIDSDFHKNHPGNLLTLCDACHKKQHQLEEHNSNMSVRVSNLTKGINENDLRDLFSQFGEILRISLPNEYYDNDLKMKVKGSRGFAYIDFARQDDAKKAISSELELYDTKLRLELTSTLHYQSKEKNTKRIVKKKTTKSNYVLDNKTASS